jgi:hypothetical protein
MPILLLCSVIAATMAYWMPELNPNFDRYAAFVGILGTHLYVVESFGILVAAVIPNFVLVSNNRFLYCIPMSRN